MVTRGGGGASTFRLSDEEPRTQALPPTIQVMKIQTLSEAHYDGAIALWHEVGLTRPWNDPQSELRRAMEADSSTVLALVDGGVLLGTAMVGHDGHRGWVYYLAVVPEAQGRGLGRLLMRACENWVCARNIPKLNLMVRCDNAAVRTFYEKLGYTDSEVIVLARRLDSPCDSTRGKATREEHSTDTNPWQRDTRR